MPGESVKSSTKAEHEVHTVTVKGSQDTENLNKEATHVLKGKLTVLSRVPLLGCASTK